MEIWKSISGYDYSVSSKGRVKNDKTGKILKPFMNQYGYYMVDLHKDGIGKQVLVSRLVAFAFIPNPDGKPYVNHKSEIPTENNVENLEWVTAKENANWGTRNKRMAQAKGKKVSKIDATGKVLEVYDSINDASSKTGLSVYFIRKSISGEKDLVGDYGFNFKL